MLSKLATLCNPIALCNPVVKIFIALGLQIGFWIKKCDKNLPGRWGDSNRLTIDWVQMGRVGRHIFHVLKSIQFACSQINLLYLGRGAFNNRPASRAARKENWSELLHGQTRNHRFVVSVKKCLHSYGFFQNGGWCG